MLWYGYVQTAQVQMTTFEANFVPPDGFASPPPTLTNGNPVPYAALVITKTANGLVATVDNAKLLTILGPVLYPLLWGK